MSCFIELLFITYRIEAYDHHLVVCLQLRYRVYLHTNILVVFLYYIAELHNTHFQCIVGEIHLRVVYSKMLYLNQHYAIHMVELKNKTRIFDILFVLVLSLRAYLKQSHHSFENKR